MVAIIIILFYAQLKYVQIPRGGGRGQVEAVEI